MERSFSHQEWKRLSPKVRQKIQAFRKARKEKRSVSKAVTIREETQSQDEPVQKPGGHGGQFGSGVYNENRKRKEGKDE